MGNKVLIIDDEAGIRESIADILTVSGYSVLQAKSGKMGLEMASREMPDLVLCDIMMPEMDGFEFLTYLKANQTTRLIPLVFLTAKAERQAQRKGMNLGADDYLLKPFSVDEVLHVVKTRIRKKQEIVEGFESRIQALQYQNKIKEAKIEELLFAISNDIREPVSKILSIARLIASTRCDNGEKSEDIKNLLSYLEQNCQNLDKVVNVIDRLSE
ncbi:MAG: response regulator [Bacteroidia bacterium]|nr:response regulator [Bacteroidia bacterium]